MPKKKFIDKKNSVTFHLVHRSQQDPLTADETAPQRVLLPVAEKGDKKDKKKQIEEQQKFGIFFDDEYNYLQHLRDTSKLVEWVEAEKPASKEKESAPKLNLPSSVFASTVEEDVGLLNKAAPRSGLNLDLDPEIVAAMDDDFDYEDPDNELQDNFMELANESCSEEEEYDGESDFGSDYSEEERDAVMSLDGGMSFRDEETKSRFTEYSMTSSVMRRNEQLTLLDNRFEKLFADYDENEIGALDCDEIEGYVPETSDILLQYAEEFEKQKKREQLDKNNEKLRTQLLDEDSDDNEELVNFEVKPKEKWDCESILSTYSNIYNHPKLITEPKKIRINPRTGLPMDVLGTHKLTSKALSQLNEEYGDVNKGTKSMGAQSIISAVSALSIRPKDESPEERKERKKQLKDYRRERRLEKKANAQAFKDEAKRQVKININNRNNVQGNRIL